LDAASLPHFLDRLQRDEIFARDALDDKAPPGRLTPEPGNRHPAPRERNIDRFG
jgi:hypothetical protein